MSVFVPGRPTGFGGGKNEAEWKAAVREATQSVRTPAEARLAIELNFVLLPDQVRGKAPDLDNLIKTTIDAMIDVIGPRPGNWKHRQADDERIDEIVARKRLASGDEPAGVSIDVRLLNRDPAVASAERVRLGSMLRDIGHSATGVGPSIRLDTVPHEPPKVG